MSAPREFFETLARKRQALSAPRRRPAKPLERTIQADFFAIAAMHIARMPELRWLTHVPNEGNHPKRTLPSGRRYCPEGVKLKRLGKKPGVPDVILPLRRGHHSGMALEFKRPGEKTTAEQAEWLAWLDSQGWQTGVYTDAQAAWEAVKAYIAGPGDTFLTTLHETPA